jgi:cation-transporting ATPase E
LISFFTIGCPAFLLALEPNNERIQGRFIGRVLFKSLPAAITDFAVIASMVVFAEVFGVSTKDVSVASTFLMSIVGFMILYVISKPINPFKFCIILGNIIGLLVAVYFAHTIFDISSVSTKCMMLFVVFAFASEPVLRYLNKLFNFFANVKNAISQKLHRKK